MWIYFSNFAKDNKLLSSDARNANRRCKNVVGVIYSVPDSPMIANFARDDQIGNNGIDVNPTSIRCTRTFTGERV